MRIVECVPNFSEGRDRAAIDALADAVRSVDGVRLLDVDPGAGANRTVITFVGEPEAALEAGFRAIRAAAERIDMRRHKGEHPRIGATDVFPFVPVSGVTMAECVRLARDLGRRVWDELCIPVYLYEHAATRPERRSLAAIRAGEYEGLARKLADPAWAPDFGEPVLNERSGATAIGARKFLVAYNVNLNTKDRRAASRIAKAIRERGLPIRAIGWLIPEYRRAQVSMNLLDFEEAGLADAFDEVCRLADAEGLRVTGSEIVGLVPEKALLDAGRRYLKRQGRSTGLPRADLCDIAVMTLGLNDVTRFDPSERIVERRIARADRPAALPVERFLARLSDAAPVPGGGSAAALAAAASGALVSMVANLTCDRKGMEAVRDEMIAAAERAQAALDGAATTIDADSDAYDAVVRAMRMPKATPRDQADRRAAIDAASRRAALVPLGLLESLSRSMADVSAVVRRGNPNCASDSCAAACLASAAAEIAHANVLANLPAIRDRGWRDRTRRRSATLRGGIVRAAARLVAAARRAI
ncbi:MAG: glutamate formimidoyltransferase, partial [Myxococcota bacterium]|nr:glutamate formimidoyltransferase [Myxococcota bacterium]